MRKTKKGLEEGGNRDIILDEVMNKINDIAVFVNSFDGYCDLWDVFWDIFDKYGSDCPFRKYSVSNELDYIRPGVINIKVGEEVNWFERTIKAIKEVKEEFFILFLEDYFISKRIDFNEIQRITGRMKEEGIFFYRLSMRSGLPKNKSFVQIPANSDYPITLQLAIWKREVFERIVTELHNEGCSSPWDFELYLKNNYRYCPPEDGMLSGIWFDTRDILGYKNGVLRGQWFPDIIKFYSRQGIDFSKSERKIMSSVQLLRYKVICFVSSSFSKTSKERINSLLLKLKIKNSI